MNQASWFMAFSRNLISNASRTICLNRTTHSMERIDSDLNLEWFVRHTFFVCNFIHQNRPIKIWNYDWNDSFLLLVSHWLLGSYEAIVCIVVQNIAIVMVRCWKHDFITRFGSSSIDTHFFGILLNRFSGLPHYRVFTVYWLVQYFTNTGILKYIG